MKKTFLFEEKKLIDVSIYNISLQKNAAETVSVCISLEEVTVYWLIKLWINYSSKCYYLRVFWYLLSLILFGHLLHSTALS